MATAVVCPATGKTIKENIDSSDLRQVGHQIVQTPSRTGKS
jgi:hypothetical protein